MTEMLKIETYVVIYTNHLTRDLETLTKRLKFLAIYSVGLALVYI